MRFKRFEITKESNPWTDRRLAAASRAVDREREAMPLFPELRRFKNVDERVEQMDEREAMFILRLRAGRAKMWREVREKLRDLDAETRGAVLGHWEAGWLPGDPTHLFALISGVERGHRLPPLPK